MKKIVFTVLLFFMLPFIINASSITSYNINAKIQDNGDLLVEEIFDLNGSYNGYERIINYQNNNNKSIYDGDGIVVLEVGAIKGSNKDLFELVNYATVGDYGKYIENNTYNGKKIKIFNPSNRNSKFYLKYIITNMAVKHNDVAELGYNIFSDEQVEFIDKLELNLNVPNNTNNIRAWGHGPLHGETVNLDNQNIKLTINNLNAYTPLDIRVVFDKEVIINSNKLTNQDSLNTILSEEQTKADIANQERIDAIENEKRLNVIKIIVTIISIFMIIGMIISIIILYLNHKKKYKPVFNNDYFRDFPSDSLPTEIYYLFNKRIDSKMIGATLLNLVFHKVIEVEIIDKKDYKFKLVYKGNYVLKNSEQRLIELIFPNDQKEITLKELKKKGQSSSTKFFNDYNKWKNQAQGEAFLKNYFEKNKATVYLTLGYNIISLVIIAFFMSFGMNPLIILFAIILFIICVVLITYQRRRIEANEEYYKWSALKKFMLDFGNFEKKELPEVVLWEKYLVFAAVLGCAKELNKSMQIKIQEFNTDSIDVGYFSSMMILNNSFNQTVNSSITKYYNSQVSSSTFSSGSGSGGGFSGGGGSFGGGGGGGRF